MRVTQFVSLRALVALTLLFCGYGSRNLQASQVEKKTIDSVVRRSSIPPRFA